MSRVAGGRPAPIYWVGGSFGGVGKSLLTMALLDVLHEAGRAAVLIEADSELADVWKAYHECVPSERLDLARVEGWIGLVDACAEHRGAALVINTPPGIAPAVRAYGGMLDGAIEELCREMVGLWVVDRRGVGERLGEFVAALPRAAVYQVCNTYRGGPSAWYAPEERGRPVLLPTLADEVTDALYSRRRSIGRALGELSPGARAELVRWRDATRRALQPVLR